MSHVKMMQKGAFMRGTDKMIVKEIPVPEIGDKEVLVSLEYVGICGSDVHYYHNGCCGAYKVDLSQDYMLGHECANQIFCIFIIIPFIIFKIQNLNKNFY